VELVKKSAAVPLVMLSGAKHLDRPMTYTRGRFFTSLRMTRGKDFFTSSTVPIYAIYPSFHRLPYVPSRVPHQRLPASERNTITSGRFSSVARPR